MEEIPTASGWCFHTSDSGERRHNSIHDRISNYSSSRRGSGSDNEHPQEEHDQQQQQQQQTLALSLTKPPLMRRSGVPMVAMQVVDRLRWWRTRRVREQPLPVHHYVFHNNYTNYSSFGTRPLAPDLMRLLQHARRVCAQYRRQQQLLPRQRALQRETSAANSSSIDDAERRQQLQQLIQEKPNMLDNKRVASPTDFVSAYAADPLVSPPDAAIQVDTGHDTQHAATSESDIVPVATTVPPLNEAIIGSNFGSTSLLSMNCTTEQEMHEAERLLRLYQPRAASVPVRSRRRRRETTSYDAHLAGTAQNLSCGVVEDSTAQPIQLTRMSTSDNMTEVRCAAVAANSAVVLHHEPRLIIYERDLNPRVALRTARVSSDALEGLRDAATENSEEVFALTNLPLSGFERFFYQQQLRGCRQDEVHSLPAITNTDQDDNHHNRAIAHAEEAFPASPPANTGGDGAVVYPPGYGVVNRDDTFYAGSPMAITSPVFSLSPQTPALSTPAGISEAPQNTTHNQQQLQQCTSRSIAERLRVVTSHGNDRRGGTRRHRQWTFLRAVSVPCLPRVYKSGYPQLLSPHATTTTDVATEAPLSPAAEVPAATKAAARGRSRAGQHDGHRFLLPSALRTSDRPQDGAHLCHRVSDLQDVYAFNPIFDAIGKGAFSKVYAAVPILRGREGMKRFHTLDDGSATSSTGKESVAESAHRREGKTAPSVSATSTTTGSSSNQRNRNSLKLHSKEGNTVAAAAPSPQRSSPSSVPVVALKVIPRKVRQKEQKVTGDSPTSPTQAQQPPPSHDDADANNSVRRELVEIEREISILRRLHHTGCSHFYEALRSPDAFAIAMRVYPGSMDARHYLSRYGSPSEARTALVLFQLVSTVHYLHTNFGLIHRDIKLENLLFSEVDTSVSNTRICEVLGSVVHKADSAAAALAAEDDFFTERPPNDSRAEPLAASKEHEVLRLLRVTLIDFGLARRTRIASAAASNMFRIRSGSTRNQSLNASMNFPSTLLSTAGLHANDGGSACSPPSPNVPGGMPPSSVATASSSSVQHHQQPQPPTSIPALAGTRTSSALATFTATRSANNSYSAMPAMPPPFFPPRLYPSLSTAAHSTVACAGISRVGMPSPMPSTANMFTRFLDLDEELDEEESVANCAFTARANSEIATGPHEASVAFACTTNSFRHPGSRAYFAEEESAASSTDISASETDSESDHGDEGEEEERQRSVAASTGEPEATTPIAQIVGERSVPTQLSSDILSQAVVSGGGVATSVSAANTPPALCQRLPPSQSYSQRDDADVTLLLTPCGTEKYLPPEVLSWVLERGWTRRSTTVALARAMDMYAIGIVAYVLLSGCFPFNASSRATLLKQQQRVPRCNSARWCGVSSAAITFVQHLLEPNPLKRMTAKEALSHPFLLEARQLAEKFSLVPHGEGEEAARCSGDNSNLALSTHGALSASNSLRAHWPPAAATRGASQLPLASTAVHSGASGGCCRTPNLASPVKVGSQPTFGVPGGRSTFSKSSTPDMSFLTASAAVTAKGGGSDAATAAPPRRDRPTTTTVHGSNNSRDSGGAVFLRSADSLQPDMFATVTRDVLGNSRPPQRDSHYDSASSSRPHSPSKVSLAMRAPTPSASAAVDSKVPGHLAGTKLVESQAAKPVQSAAAALTTPTTEKLMKSKPAPANSSSAKGGGDDLFESLYHNIMFSE